MSNQYGNMTIFADVIADNAVGEKILLPFGLYCQSERKSEHNGDLVMIRNYVQEIKNK